MSVPLGVSFVNCHYMSKNPAKILTFGFDKFEPTHVSQIKHGSYKHPAAIRIAYVNNQGSKELNLSMSLALQENEKIHDDIRKRILVVLNEFKSISIKKILYDQSYVVFHGTTQEIHQTLTFVTTSFLSTTRSFSIARSYGTIMYVITVPPKFPFINFQDILQQILLPIGTYIKVDHVVEKPCKTFFCHITDEPIVIDPFITIFQNPCENDNVVTLKDNTSKLCSTFMRGTLFLPIIIANCSSTFYASNIDSNTYYTKDIIKRSNVVRALTSDNQVFKRILNEVLAAHIYSRVYDLDTLDYTILDKKRYHPALTSTSNYLLVSKVEPVKYALKEHSEIYKGFLVDCIMGNWDVFNNNNVGIHETKQTPIRTDVGGALAFRGRGDQNINFRKGNEPLDHILITQQVSFANMKIAGFYMNTALDYLKSISVTKVKARLKKVAKEFGAFIDLVNEKALAKQYHALLDQVIDAVIYRDAWYRKNGLDALKLVANKFVNPIVGGDATADTYNLEINNGDITDIDASPMSFAASPGQFARMIARQQHCTLVNVD